jgi:leucyl-tRNA---protein transferase
MGAQQDIHTLRFFLTVPRPCAYLDGRQAVSVVADPEARLNPALYSDLALRGFRRSGADVYRPACPGCDACVPLRIPVPYSPNRSQERVLRRNRAVQIEILPAEFRDDHFQLYRRYLAARHPHGGMAETNADQYREFLISCWSKTVFIEFREDGRLLAVAVTDLLDDALSAVYTFFDPAEAGRSLGTFAILSQMNIAERARLRWTYLGYWINACDNMRYKARFKPHEVLRDGRWQRVA